MPSYPLAQDRALVRSKQDQAIEFMRKQGIDAWCITVTEGTDGLNVAMIAGVDSMHSVATFILTKTGRRIAVLSQMDLNNKVGLFFDEVMPGGNDPDGVVAKLLKEINPGNLALNYSRRYTGADGLGHGLFLRVNDVMEQAGLAGRHVSAEDIVMHLRSVKTDEEISRLRRAAVLTAESATVVSEQFRVGMTETDLTRLIRGKMVSLGADAGGASVIANPQGENIKGRIDRPIQPGDVIVADFGARFGGFGADRKRCWYVLKPGEDRAPENLAYQWKVCLETLFYALTQLRPGRPGYEVHEAAWSFMERKGFKRGQHSFGHQVGRTAHDVGTWLGDRSNTFRPAEGLLEESNVVTLDPTMNRHGLTNPDSYCLGMEEMAVIRANGGELLDAPQTSIFLLRG